MNTYILIDTMNTFFRARHSTRGDIDMKVGMALHVTLNSIRKAWKDFNGSHVVFLLDGRSWRKDFYKPYKRNRQETRSAMKPAEIEEDKVFWEVYDELLAFVREKTNCTILKHPNLEADDLIAGWVQNHPNDNHVIISTDGDFAQLIAPNVKQYNGVSNVTTTHEGYFDAKGKRVIDTKTKEVKPAPEPQWLLFEKCMRGDTSDNVFSAYPGVRTKGSKNKVGLQEAYADRKSRGFAWNNMMLQRWVDHEGVEHRVMDDYQRNVTLCDLTAQPENIRNLITETITTVESKDIQQVGIKLIKFCAKWNLVKIGEQVEEYAAPLNGRYNNVIQS